MINDYQLCDFEVIRSRVPATFERIHEFLDVISDKYLQYHLPEPLPKEFDWEDPAELKLYFNNVQIDFHWLPDMSNPKFWEHEYSRFGMLMKNPIKRLESKTVTCYFKIPFCYVL